MAMTPRDAVARLTRDAILPAWPGDVFSGWGVVGLPFQSRHVLALRRCVASSIGPAYTSVWHRDPLGSWTFYSTVSPDCSCARYYGGQVDRNVVTAIDLEWPTPWTLHVRVGRLVSWHLALRASTASRGLGLGSIHHRRRTPNGHRFTMHLRQWWGIDASSARVSGLDIGPRCTRGTPALLDEMGLPCYGVVAVTSLRFERGSAPPNPRTSGPLATFGGACANPSRPSGLTVKNHGCPSMAPERAALQNRRR